MEPYDPQIASLYAPNGIKPNDLRPIVWVVCFLPWRPTSILPTMDKDISAGYLTERWHYFIAEIFMLCAVVGAILEVAAFIVNRVQRKPGGELSEPLLFEVQNRTRPSRPLWYALSFAMWYVVYQIGLYIAMDIVVMCGMISLETGPDWELWAIFIEAICATHLAVGLATYVVHRDRKHDHPSTMLATCLLPVLGNEIHIFKDHVAGALCFAVAHCSSGDLRTAGVVMGYLSLVSTFIPLALLCADPTARSGLPTAHWPIAEAAPPELVGNERCSPEEDVDNMFERIGFGKGPGTLRTWHFAETLGEDRGKGWWCSFVRSSRHFSYYLGKAAEGTERRTSSLHPTPGVRLPVRRKCVHFFCHLHIWRQNWNDSLRARNCTPWFYSDIWMQHCKIGGVYQKHSRETSLRPGR